MAQDPLCKQLLDEAQSQHDQVFTPTGLYAGATSSSSNEADSVESMPIVHLVRLDST